MCRWRPSSRDIYSQLRMPLSLKVFSSVMCEARVVFIYANDNGEASKMKYCYAFANRQCDCMRKRGDDGIPHHVPVGACR